MDVVQTLVVVVAGRAPDDADVVEMCEVDHRRGVRRVEDLDSVVAGRRLRQFPEQAVEPSLREWVQEEFWLLDRDDGAALSGDGGVGA
jgi:hypothetical protein